MMRRAALALAAALAMTGCAGAPRALVADQHVRITSPAPLDVVSAPFTVRWTSTHPSDRSFAVFVDLQPVPPGHQLRDLADDQCKRIRGCPDAGYLASRGVFVTDRPEVEVPTLPDLRGTGARVRHPAHTVTIVTLDGTGRRTGEGSWQLEVRS